MQKPKRSSSTRIEEGPVRFVHDDPKAASIDSIPITKENRHEKFMVWVG
jgi:hypothetical protein